MGFFSRIGDKIKSTIKTIGGRIGQKISGGLSRVGGKLAKYGGIASLASLPLMGVPIVGEVAGGVSGVAYGIGKGMGWLGSALT